MELYTKRLILRPWREEDASELYTYAKDEHVGPPAGWPPHTSVENSQEIIRTVLSAPYTYAVVLRTTGKPVGSIGLMIGNASKLTESDREAEIGYWIGVPFWGQGLIPEAVREVQRFAFEELGMEKLWCGYYDGNVKSRRVQEKCGFRYVHTTENLYLPLMDEIRTGHETCITKAEWLADCQFRIRPAVQEDLDCVLHITQTTICEIYPHYYPAGAVAFFMKHHHSDAAAKDIADGFVYLAVAEDGTLAGTVTIHDNEICRLFVLPDYQGQGIGSSLLRFAEQKIALQYPTAKLDASFPAKKMYLRHGYKVTQCNLLASEDGDYLYYDEMEKVL